MLGWLSTSALFQATSRAHARVMSSTVPGTQRKIPRGLIILIWVVIGLLFVLAALIELARGFREVAAAWVSFVGTVRRP